MKIKGYRVNIGNLYVYIIATWKIIYIRIECPEVFWFPLIHEPFISLLIVVIKFPDTDSQFIPDLK